MDLKEGVYPVYKNQWQVGPTKDALTAIADMETFSVSLDNGIEEWNPMDQEGWVRRLMTAKSVTISISCTSISTPCNAKEVLPLKITG